MAPAGHITLRINASGGGDLVNPTAATIGHHGLAGKPRLRFVKKKKKQWEIKLINQAATPNLLTPTIAYL